MLYTRCSCLVSLQRCIFRAGDEHQAEPLRGAAGAVEGAPGRGAESQARAHHHLPYLH